MDSQDQSQAGVGVVAAAPEAAEWLLAERTVYALQTAYGPRGEPQLANRWSFNVQGGPGATEAELKAVAQLARSAPVLLAALQEAASWFDAYADEHLAKGATEKGLRNKTRANILRTAISKALGQ